MFVDFLKDIIGFIFFGPIRGEQGVLEDRLGRCHRFSTQWMETSEPHHRISSFNELGGGFSRFNYSEGGNTHCRALDMGMWVIVGRAMDPARLNTVDSGA